MGLRGYRQLKKIQKYKLGSRRKVIFSHDDGRAEQSAMR